MATKQPTQLCYQVNGGTCRNKVSAKNYYVCAAGHRAVKGMSRDEIATQLPAEAIRKMGEVAQRELARNPSIDRAMMQALFDTGDEWVKRDLATNPSIDREMAITLAKDGHAPIGYLENKSITELCNGENISLLNEYPQKFGQAYLNHLLGSDEDLDQMKALLCYSYDCYRKADGYNPEHYKGLILDKYPGDEEIKYLLSGD